MIRILMLAAALVAAPVVLADDEDEAAAAKLRGEAMTAMEAGDMDMAKLKFEAALGYDDRDAPSYHGLARIQLRRGNLEAAEDLIKRGLRYASRRERDLRLDLYAASIRLENQRGEFRDARGDYRRARRIDGAEEHAEIHLAMAQAHIMEKEYEDARELLNMAIAIDSPFKQEAQNTLSNMQLIERASAVSTSDLVYANEVTRAEVAKLLFKDFAIARMMGDTEKLEKPVKGETSDQGLTDYTDHMNRDSILAVHRMGVRSLAIRNGAFKPDEAITRMELALVVEDVLAEKQGLSRTKFIGTASPYSDLSNSSTGFNAIMTAVTRGLMQVDESGLIRPNDLVSGAETILVLDKLEDILEAS